MGTKYHLELALKNGIWYLQITMDENVEEALKLPGLSRRDIENSLLNLLEEFYLPINDFQKEKLLEDFLEMTKEVRMSSSSEEAEDVNRQAILSQKSSKTNKKKEKKNFDAEQSSKKLVVNEFRNRLENVERPEVKDLFISTITKKDTDTDQIRELVRSHKEIEITLQSLDERIRTLEKLTLTLINLVESLAKN